VTVQLRPLSRNDLSRLLALQHATSAPAWTMTELEGQLLDPGRAHGANVVVAVRGDAIAGVAGWVDADGVQFGAPVIAADREAADVLVDHLVRRAQDRRAAWLRIGCAAREQAKRDALAARGFRVQLEFLTLACTAAPRAHAAIDLAWAALDEVDPAVVQLLHDETFADVDNAPAISLDEARHMQRSGWRDASGVWFAGETPAAYVVALRDGDAVEISEIGVRAGWRRRGLARALVDRTIDIAAARDAREVTALIASTNPASLALHVAAGLSERHRRAMYQLDLDRNPT
jgi:ribosomal protein S18 acetylase RimI-like enzyme